MRRRLSNMFVCVQQYSNNNKLNYRLRGTLCVAMSKKKTKEVCLHAVQVVVFFSSSVSFRSSAQQAVFPIPSVFPVKNILHAHIDCCLPTLLYCFVMQKPLSYIGSLCALKVL